MYIPRLLESDIRASLASKKVLFLLGARQVGKTTLVKKVLEGKGGVLLNMDIAADRARFLAAAQLDPGEGMKTLGATTVLVIDEAQRYPDIGRIVKGWYDSDVGVKMILLGSSSLNLLDAAAEALTGRNEKQWLTPLLFAEILPQQSWYQQVFTANQLTGQFSAQLQALLPPLLVFGSYPEAYLTAAKEEYVLNLVADYLLKDVMVSSLVRSVEMVRKLLQLLAYQVGSEVSTSELAGTLGMSRQTLDRYLDLLEKTFVIFRLPSLSTNPRKEISKSKKIYFWDTGVKNALQNEFSLSPQRSDIGSLWENWVVAEFAKRNLMLHLHQDLFFWRTRGGSEVDLVVKKGRAIQAYEIKWAPGKLSSRTGFADRYGVTPHVVHRENFFVHLLAS